MSTQLDAKEIALSWITSFSYHLSAGDADGLSSLFHPDSWLRDALVLTWDTRSLHGHDNILTYLKTNLRPSTFSDIKLSRDSFLQPTLGPVTLTKEGVSSGFTFSTPIGHGIGFFSIIADDLGYWKAFTVFISLDSLHNHEERGAELGVYNGHTEFWTQVRERRWKRVEDDPHVLIVGGGQNGLQVAARFQQMNIPALVIDKSDRIGDQWRKRYPTLTLHTPKEHHTMLYQPYPQNWPLYTPRDKIADWIEQYVVSQDLCVWTKSRCLPFPTYDRERKRWTVTIDRNGIRKTINPTHIVLAIGTAAIPYIPSIPGEETYKGKLLHSSSFPGGSGFSGKRAVVIGVGNSGADIAQDLSLRGAHSVTLVQRSSICAQTSQSITALLHSVWSPGVPTEICDFRNECRPMKLTQMMLEEQMKTDWDKDKELVNGLQEAGMILDRGPNGAGLLPLVYQRLGGYWLDVGCGELIMSGKIKIKAGVEVERLTESSLVFSDSSTLEADVVVLATGYLGMQEAMKEIFDVETIDRVGPVWGMDDEGELQGAYRPTGHPGLWYAPGDFQNCRVGSKYLALQIKAIELGYMKSL